MAHRIGNVLYWLGCIVAGLTALLAVFVFFTSQNQSEGLLVMLFVLVFAFLAWLIGRACRYVLAGR
jgi:uncharacterized protein with PQ loop repeat